MWPSMQTNPKGNFERRVMLSDNMNSWQYIELVIQGLKVQEG